jgi:hypothetical protein
MMRLLAKIRLVPVTSRRKSQLSMHLAERRALKGASGSNWLQAIAGFSNDTNLRWFSVWTPTLFSLGEDSKRRWNGYS